MPSKTQLGPRVEDEFASDYRNFVRFVNDGTYKGRLGREVQEGLQYQMALYFALHPEEIDRAANSEFIDDDEFPEKIMRYVDACGDDIIEAARNLETDEPQELTEHHSFIQAPETSRSHSERLFGSDTDDEVLRRLESLEQKVEDFLESRE